MTKTKTTLGPRPAPSAISFEPNCFTQDGCNTYWTVTKAFGLPARFEDKAAAEEYASKVGRAVVENVVPRMVRVSWS